MGPKEGLPRSQVRNTLAAVAELALRYSFVPLDVKDSLKKKNLSILAFSFFTSKTESVGCLRSVEVAGDGIKDGGTFSIVSTSAFSYTPLDPLVGRKMAGNIFQGNRNGGEYPCPLPQGSSWDRTMAMDDKNVCHCYV